MNAKEAIKRLRQETCPATYNRDFDKEACLRTIEDTLSKQAEILAILKKYPEWVGSFSRVRFMANYWRTGNVTVTEFMLQAQDFPFSVDEFNAIVKWLEE